MKIPKKQVLLVEDDDSLCGLLEKILEVSYDVKAMNNSIDAWNWLSEGNHPHLVVTDVKMPIIDGLELVENIKTSGLFQDLPVIILSGSCDPVVKEKCSKWVVQAFLTKPFSPDQLLKTAKEAIKSQNHRYYA